MPDVHLLQWAVAFAVAAWLTARWMLTRPETRWRHLVAGIVTTLLWLPVAYTAGNVHVADGGSKVAFGSDALGTFAIFMVVVCIVNLVVGFMLWVEGAVDESHKDLPDGMQHRPERSD